MQHYKLVLPEYLNDHGSLFGGYLLKWLDEFAYVTVKVDFPGLRFVTIALDNVLFKHPIACGQVLRFEITQARRGRTSVDYEVEVFIENNTQPGQGAAFATRITFVNVDEHGNKVAIAKT